MSADPIKAPKRSFSFNYFHKILGRLLSPVLDTFDDVPAYIVGEQVARMGYLKSPIVLCRAKAELPI